LSQSEKLVLHFTLKKSCLAVVASLALAACQSAALAEIDPALRVEAAQVAFARAAAAEEQGEPELALEAMRLAASLRPNHPTLLLNLAAMEIRANQLARASLILQRVASMGVGIDLSEMDGFQALLEREDTARIVWQLKRQTEPVGESELVFRADAAPMPFLPEGVAYDEERGHWLLSSVAQSCLCAFAVNADGSSRLAHQFSTPGGAMGISFDSATSTLWFVASTMDGFHPGPQRGSLGVLEFRDPSKLVFLSTGLPGEAESHAGDLLRLSDGTVLVSDGTRGTIWSFPQDGFADGGKGRAPTQWLQGARLPSPQGMAEALGFVYLADYSTGLHRIDRKTGQRLALTRPEDLCDLGIDGLAATADGRLIAVQNGFAPQRIVELSLSSDGAAVESWRVLAAGIPEWQEPTLGFVREGYFYFVANSHWPSFAKPQEPDLAQGAPEVHRVKL